MALLFIDGFEWITDQAAIFNGAGRYTSDGGGGSSFDKITDTASGTGAAARLQSVASLIRPVDDQTLYFGFRFRTGSISGGTVEFCNVKQAAASSSVHLTISITPSGNIQVRRGTIVGSIIATTTHVMTAGVWSYLEFKYTIDNSAGALEIRIDGSGTPDVDLSSIDTQNAGGPLSDAILLHGNNVNHDFDDFYIDDAQFHGDVFITTLVPDGVGADADFTPSAGSNWENVDELPVDEDTTYNESSTAAHQDRHTFTDLPATADTVIGVQVSTFSKKQAAGPREIRLVAYDGVTEGDGALDHTPGTEWEWDMTMFEDHPTGAAAWTTSEVDAGEFGYKIQT